MGPTSKVLLVVIVLITAALLWLTARSGRWFVKAPAAVLAFVLSVSTGVLVVNDYYGYYTTWGSAVADLSGSGAAFAVAHGVVSTSRGSTAADTGRLMSVPLPGRRSGISRDGLVYLPPQYFESRYRHLRFPVLELFHGTPGNPAQWVNQMRVTEIAEKLINSRRMGPVVLVMPYSNGGLNKTEECLNTPSFHDDTYVTYDVPADIQARFRVSRDRSQWGTVGVSSGGYCAANLMLRHPDEWGSAASIDGYYRPDVENAAPLIGSNPVLSRANDPLATAQQLPPGTEPLPPFWVGAGTGELSDYDYAKAMVTAMRRLENVPFMVVRGEGHTVIGQRSMVPSALVWSWQQVCTPAERRQFPTYAFGRGQTVVVTGHGSVRYDERKPVHRLPTKAIPTNR